MKGTLHKHRFELGHIVGTPDAMQALTRAGKKPGEFLWRHAIGDWGELNPADWAENNRSLEDDLELRSVYALQSGVKIVIITDAARSETTILLPEEG